MPPSASRAAARCATIAFGPRLAQGRQQLFTFSSAPAMTLLCTRVPVGPRWNRFDGPPDSLRTRA